MNETELIERNMELLTKGELTDAEMLIIEDFIRQKITDIKEDSLSNNLNGTFVCPLRDTLRQRLQSELVSLQQLVLDKV